MHKFLPSSTIQTWIHALLLNVVLYSRVSTRLHTAIDTTSPNRTLCSQCNFRCARFQQFTAAVNPIGKYADHFDLKRSVSAMKPIGGCHKLSLVLNICILNELSELSRCNQTKEHIPK